MEDLEIVDPDKPWRVRLASALSENITPLKGYTPIDGVIPNVGDFVLLWAQTTGENGIYRVHARDWVKIPIDVDDFIVSGTDGKSNRLDNGKWRYSGNNIFKLLKQRKSIWKRRRGVNRQLEEQLTPDARFARIYG